MNNKTEAKFNGNVIDMNETNKMIDKLKEKAELRLHYDILFGRFLFQNLPTIKTRSIRLFLCAPFNDTFEEVNYLYKFVFPKLREFTVSRFGFEFQVVNLNWDVDIKENILKDNIFELESIIGDEYGEASLPDWIDREKFDLIKKILKENNYETENLLEKFYKLNINFLSNRYELTIEEENYSKQRETYEQLITGVKLCIKKGFLNETYLQELTETNLHKLMSLGVFKNESKKNKVFTFVRLNNDNFYTENNNNNNTNLKILRDKEINYHFPVEQIYRIKLITKKDEKYLQNFGNNYLKLFENLIEKFVQSNPVNEEAKNKLLNDVLYHLNYINLNKIKELASGSEKIMKDLSDYVFDDNNRQPFILTGPLGSGKTSCLATFASNLYLQLAAYETTNFRKHAILIRFIGIDNNSKHLRSLLKSICLQLNYISRNSEEQVINNDVPNKLVDLKKYFKKHLTQSSSATKNQQTKLIIILDSLQDLSKNDHSYKLDWLPKHLGSNSKLILAVSSESTELIQRLKRRYTNEQKSFSSLDYLTKEQCEYMIRKFLSSKNYRLNEQQLNKLNDLITTKPILSLHMKLLSEEFLNWKSYTPLEKCCLKETLKDSIIDRIIKIENKFGFVFVKHLLSYLTLSTSGFSELELQDLLSLDNELLKEIKSKNLMKETSDVIRIPWFYILRCLNELDNHLIVKPHQGIFNISWRHQIFSKIVYDRYLKNNETFETHLQKTISEYYLGIWSNSKLKPLYYEQIIMPETNTSDNKISFDKPIVKKIKLNLNRLVPIQPLKYDDYHTHIKARFNLRKLHLLPYHLIKANMIKEIFEHVYFNIEWLYFKIEAIGLHELLNDFDLLRNDIEVDLVSKSLKMSEEAIIENPKLLFNELTSRLLPFIHSYENISNLVKQCDVMSAKLNPLVPIGPVFSPPSWINEETLDLGIKANDNIQIDLLESEMNGRVLAVKNTNSTSTKFFDLDLNEPLNDLNTPKGIVYCTRNGEFACIIENNSKLTVKRIENGEWYGNVDFEQQYDIAHVHISTNYITFTLRKSPSPILIDLRQCKLLKKFPYQTCFCFISLDEKVMLIHSEKNLYYYQLSPDLERLINLECIEIPENVLFAKNNSQVYVLSKDTKQITFYNLILSKKHYQSKQILQDREIIDFKMAPNESILIVCSLYCVYVLELNSEQKNILFKITTNSIDSYLNIDYDYATCISRPSSAYSSGLSSFSTISSKELELKLKTQNIFTGFGCNLTNNIIYVTYYTYLICYDAKNGSLLRVFQSTVSANRIVRSISSRLSDSLVSILDDGKIIIWNLASVNMNSIKFDEYKVYNDKVVDCLIPYRTHNLNKYQPDFFMSYSIESPDAKIHDLTKQSSISSILKSCTNEEIDDPLSSKIKSISLDEDGKFCFLVCDIDEFVGKRLPEEADFIKRLCTLISLETPSVHKVLQQYSFIIKKNSRFEISSQFINKINGECYLLLKIVSCLNDFDSYSKSQLDWTDFETQIKIYGPISNGSKFSSFSSNLELFDEFKLNGECLNEGFCISRQSLIFGSLMQECNKLYDKLQPNVIRAKRFDLRLNIYDLFLNKLKSIKVQLFSLNEFLTKEEYSNKNAFIDLRSLYNGLFLIIYTKEGTISQTQQNNNQNKTINPNHANTYEYDYEKFRFKRNIETFKGAILYDPKTDKIVKKYQNIFTKETNVETLIISSNGKFILDNLWNLYDIDYNRKEINNLCKLAVQNSFDYQLTQFLFSGRYFITTNHSQIFLVRCYDMSICGSIRINGRVSCLKAGECDRTILAGTENGNVFAMKLIIDLEFEEAIKTYLGYYRNYPKKLNNLITNNDVSLMRRKKRQQNVESKDNWIMLSADKNNNEEKIEAIKNNDIKRVLHSAHAHRQLISREMKLKSIGSATAQLSPANNYLTSSSFLSSTSIQSTSLKNLNLDLFHSGLAKKNLTNITNGIKHTQSQRQISTRACLIQ